MRNEDDLFLTEEDYAEAAANGIDRDFADERFYEWGYSKKRTKEPVKPDVPDHSNGRRGRFMDPEKRKWADIAAENKIPYNTFNNRINKHNMSYEMAATKPIDVARRNSNFKGGPQEDGQATEEDAKRNETHVDIAVTC